VRHDAVRAAFPVKKWLLPTQRTISFEKYQQEMKIDDDQQAADPNSRGQ
jgi:hypothetical protein